MKVKYIAPPTLYKAVHQPRRLSREEKDYYIPLKKDYIPKRLRKFNRQEIEENTLLSIICILLITIVILSFIWLHTKFKEENNRLYNPPITSSTIYLEREESS